MKNVVFSETGREIEFKPDIIFDKYLELTEKDLKKKIKVGLQFIDIDCPACHSDKKSIAFSKFGLNYVECQACRTVYLSPCPSDTDIKDHYLNSASSRYWRDHLSKATEEKRKEKIHSMRFQWIVDLTEEYLPKARSVADLRNMDMGYVQAFLKAKWFKNKFVIEPYFDATELAVDGRGAKIVPDMTSLEKIGAQVDVVTAFEVLDNASDIDGLLNAVKKVLVPGGLFFITTISISGFDLQVLWGNSKTIFPFDRTKLFSNKGLALLFKRHGFEMLEYSTPGVLDFDIVKNAVQRDSSLSVSRFVQTLINRENEQLNRDFQEFLQINKLSSFVRMVLRKKL